MRKLIRRILLESYYPKGLERYISKSLENQVKSGLTPKLDWKKLKSQLLTDDYYDNIKNQYFDFVGGEQEAFKMFKKFIDGRIITEKDLKNIGFKIHPEDKYKVLINAVYTDSYDDSENNVLEVGFELLDAQYIIDGGIVLSLEQLNSEEYDDIWNEITDSMKWEIEDYVLVQALNYGLEYSDVDLQWND
jgi:hypothetical protein